MTVLIDYGMDSDNFGCFYMSHTHGKSIARVSETARTRYVPSPWLSPFFMIIQESLEILSQLRGGAHLFFVIIF